MTPEAAAGAVRRMEAGDLDAVAAIEAALYPNPWRREHFEDFLALASGIAWVAVEADGLVAGYGVGWVAADEAEVANLAVAAERRGRGTGGRLLDAVLREAGERGARRVWLEVRVSNAPAQALYERHGFRVIGMRRGYYARPREDALVMALEIAAARTPAG